MKRIRVIQVGTWKRTHADHVMLAMRSMPHIYQVLGVCEPDALHREEAMQRQAYAGLTWLTLEECFALKPDAVMIETNELEQGTLALPFAQRGFNLYIDKPVGADPEVFRQLAELAKQNGTVLKAAYMYRHNPAVVRAMEIIRSGRLGEIISMEAQMSQRYKRDELDWLGQLPGGMFFYLGCHLVDLLYGIMGQPQKVIPMHRSSGTEGTAALDAGLALYEYAHGYSMLKTVACEVNGNMRRYIMISGTKGTIEISPIEVPTEAAPITNANNVNLKCTTVSQAHPGKLYTEETSFGPYGRYDNMLVEFAQIVSGEKQNAYPPEYELAVHDLLLRSCGVTDKD